MDRSGGAEETTPAAAVRPDTYGESFADVYEDWYGAVTDAEATADFVAGRAGSGPVLELGVGTGRLARPLLARGLDVIGLDASASMLTHGRYPPNRATPPLVLADMAALPFRARFGAVLLGFNTLFNLPTAVGQRALFADLASLLADDGVVIVEAMHTDGLADGPRRSVALNRRHSDGVTVVGTSLDPLTQTIHGLHLDVRADGLTARPWFLRWSTAEEIESYARSAGFHLEARQWGWGPAGSDEASSDEPASDDNHVSVFRLGSPAGGGPGVP